MIWWIVCAALIFFLILGRKASSAFWTVLGWAMIVYGVAYVIGCGFKAGFG